MRPASSSTASAGTTPEATQDQDGRLGLEPPEPRAVGVEARQRVLQPRAGLVVEEGVLVEIVRPGSGEPVGPGEIGEVVGMQKTFITERPAEGTSSGLTATAGEGIEKVTVDDASIFMAKFTGGALGTFEATRMAPGRKNYNRFELNGSKGTLVWCFEDLNYLDYYSTEDPGDRQGFRRIIATEGVHPYAGAWWPPGHMMGYDHTFSNAAADLVQCIANDKSCAPCFQDGAQCVAVLEAVDKSIEGGKWAKVEMIE